MIRQLKTLGIGKQAETNSDGDWGTVQILIYPAGTASRGTSNRRQLSLQHESRTERFRFQAPQYRIDSSDSRRI